MHSYVETPVRSLVMAHFFARNGLRIFSSDLYSATVAKCTT